MVTADAAGRQKHPHQIIRASAGTGKTFALSNRYLQLLIDGVECHSILATTFSRKGAGEILDRIIHRLSAAALDDAAAAKLADELQVKLDRVQAATILKQLLRNLHRLEVGTLDSFFNRVARAFSLEIGLPSNWEIVDEQTIAQLEDDAIQQVLQDESTLSLLHMLSKGEASRRVASMIRDTVGQVYEMYRNSGPDAWDQIQPQGRMLDESELSSIVDDMQAIEYDKKQLREHWQKVAAIASSADWNDLLGQTSFQRFLKGENKYNRTKLLPEMIGCYNRLLPHLKAIVSQQVIHVNRSTRDLLQPFGELLEAAKDATGQLRFDDVTDRLQGFAKKSNTDHFSFRLDNQIQHLLLDEFQDTSPAQWNVIEPFARKIVAKTDSSRSFFCVGDMKQAIFGWRGGVAEIFDVVDSTLPNLNALTLSKSYRSAPVVIDCVNQIFGNLEKYSCADATTDQAVYRWGQWFTKHSAEHQHLAGYVTLEMAADCDRGSKSIEERKDRLRNQNLVDAAVNRIRQLARDLPPHQTIGVLVRRNKEVAELIGKLRLKGVPASEEGGSQLTDSVAVDFLLSAIQLADHPEDGLARFHLSYSPLADEFGLQPENDTNVDANRDAAKLGAARLRRRLMEDGYGPVIEWLARQLTPQATKRETIRLQQLVRAAYDRSDDPVDELRPHRFAQYVREEIKPSGENSARVRVMTIHRSKGLEFDAVVLPFQLTSKGWAGQTPAVVVGRQSPVNPIETATRYFGESKRALMPASFEKLFENDTQQKVCEAMCVLYVMLTRAKHAIHIIVSAGAKPDHKSPAGVLMATLTDGQREEGLLYEHGRANWHDDTDDATPLPTETDRYDLQKFYLNDAVQLRPAKLDQNLNSKRGLPRILPSLVSEGDQVDLKTVFESWANFDSFLRGQILHGCFEKLHWIDEEVPETGALLQHLRRIAPSVQEFGQYLDDFQRILGQPKVAALFSRHGYQQNYLSFLLGDAVGRDSRIEVCTERRFAVATEQGYVHGVIDRLVLAYRGDQLLAADVIDLKTDRFGADKLHQRIGQYNPQLETYRLAAAKFLGLPINQISTRLVFVESGHIVNVHSAETIVDFRPVSKIKKSKKTRSDSAKQNEPPSANKPTKSRPRSIQPAKAKSSKDRPAEKLSETKQAAQKLVQKNLFDKS